MGESEKEQLIVGTQLSREPEIGRWLWALQNTRERTMREIARLTPAMIDWLPPDGGSSIGAILYHLADIEADTVRRGPCPAVSPGSGSAVSPSNER